MKKLLCLLLALVMVLSLAACSDSDSGSKSKKDKKDKDDEQIVAEKDDNEDENEDENADEGKTEDKDDEKPVDLSAEIVGTWYIEITYTEAMLGMEDMNIEGFPITVPAHFIFNADGEVTQTFPESAAESLKMLSRNMLVGMLYASTEAEGMTREEAAAAFEEENGVSIEELADSSLEGIDITEMYADSAQTFDYSLDGNMLTIDGSEMMIEIKGGQLIVTECKDEDFWGDMGMQLPIVMERVQ